MAEFRILTDWARETLAEADGDVQEATRRLKKRFLEHPDIQEEVWDDVLAYVCRGLVEQAHRDSRDAYWAQSAAAVPVAKKGEKPKPNRAYLAGAIAEAKEIRRSAYDYPLRGGKKLRDALIADLEEEHRMYASGRVAYHRMELWIGAILREMQKRAKQPDKDTVGQVLRENELERMRRKAARTAGEKA